MQWAGVIAILLFGGIAGYGFWEENRAGESADRIARELSGMIQEHQEEQGTQAIDNADLLRAEMERQAAAGDGPPLIEIDGARFLGILSIPSLELELPVNNEWTYEKLRATPCRYAGDFVSSLVISAHNYRRHFRYISTLTYGDEITITDAAGHLHRYRVALVTRLHESEVDAMVNTPYDLTLFTCTTTRTERVTVRAVRVGRRPPTARRPSGGRERRPPNYRIDYRGETIRVRRGDLYSLDGGDNFHQAAGAVVLDVSGHITDGAPIHLKRAPTRSRPDSQTQVIMPARRAALEGRALEIANGRLRLDSRYEVYDPVRGRWGRLPRVTESAEYDIRLRATARTQGGIVSGSAASAAGRLVIEYGTVTVRGREREGIVSAEIRT